MRSSRAATIHQEGEDWCSGTSGDNGAVESTYLSKEDIRKLRISSQDLIQIPTRGGRLMLLLGLRIAVGPELRVVLGRVRLGGSRLLSARHRLLLSVLPNGRAEGEIPGRKMLVVRACKRGDTGTKKGPPGKHGKRALKLARCRKRCFGVGRRDAGSQWKIKLGGGKRREEKLKSQANASCGTGGLAGRGEEESSKIENGHRNSASTHRVVHRRRNS